MNFKYRVTLDGIKGFFRVYAVRPDTTLYTFQKQMRLDMEFPPDVPVLFKGYDAAGTVVARYAFVDLGYGTVDQVTIADTVKAGIFSFVFFYDTAEKRSVTVSFEDDFPGTVSSPLIVESKGPNPIEFLEHGYVSFEDMTKEQLARDEEDDDEEEGFGHDGDCDCEDCADCEDCED
ncbi:MAG: hypothetical protein MJY61_02475 [Bacteroidales bacterium]|nr:hypothetical protein [Bacteroidales bacterium]